MNYLNKKIVILCACVIVSCPLFAQVTEQSPNWGWPVRTEGFTTHTGYMVGTPGEYRTPYIGGAGAIFGEPYPAGQHRFHRGVDIVGDDGPSGKVYSIEDGSYVVRVESSGFNKRVLINGTIYWHVVVPFATGETISANEQFATMFKKAGHVHVQKPGTNYLIERLPRYQDLSLPEILDYSFRQDGHNLTNASPELNYTLTISGQQRTLCYGKADIVVTSRDSRVNQFGMGDGGNLAPNRLGYQLFDEEGMSIDDGIFNLDFTESPLQEAASTVFGQGTRCCVPPPVSFRYDSSSNRAAL